MKNKLILFKIKYSVLFYDILGYLASIDTWETLRKESETIYKLMAVIYK